MPPPAAYLILPLKYNMANTSTKACDDRVFFLGWNNLSEFELNHL